jgi:hypothetical protein
VAICPADSSAREYGVRGSRGYTSAALDPDEVADEAADVVDDALDELERLARQARRRNPSLTKAAAFAKVYSENHELAAKERLQTRPR